jgi:hypothetical protein
MNRRLPGATQQVDNGRWPRAIDSVDKIGRTAACDFFTCAWRKYDGEYAH